MLMDILFGVLAVFVAVLLIIVFLGGIGVL